MHSARSIFDAAVRQYPEAAFDDNLRAACEAIIDRYPYFVVPYVLRAMAAHLTDALDKWDVIAQAAARVPDRAAFRRQLIQRVPLDQSSGADEPLDAVIHALRTSSARPPVPPPDHDDFVTETMARLFEIQGAVDDAIRCYQILMRKNPEKSRYFAEQIERLQNNPSE